MMKNVIFFSEEQELQALTGLSHEKLWDNGFNLDDWDWGFCSVEQWGAGDWDQRGPFEDFLLGKMDDYCCGYEETYYRGRWYYMLYHA